MKRLHRVVIGAGVIAALGCGRGEEGNGGAAGRTADPQAPAGKLGLAGGGSSIRLVLTGGPKPGTYEKRSADPTCTVGWASEGAWGNAASDLEDKSGLIGIDLIVPKPDAAKNGTSDFMMIAYLDDRLDPKNQFTIEPQKGKGSGTVTIDDRGSTAKVRVRGKTAEGVGVEATIDCDHILRAE